MVVVVVLCMYIYIFWVPACWISMNWWLKLPDYWSNNLCFSLMLPDEKTFITHRLKFLQSES